MKSFLSKLSIIAAIVALVVSFFQLSDKLNFSLVFVGVFLLIVSSFLVGMYSSKIAERVRKISHTPRVFLSYSFEDTEIASEIADALRNSGVKVWDAYNQIKPGENWQVAVGEALSSTDTLVKILSDSPTNWETLELKVAKKHNINIIPVLTGKEMYLSPNLAKLDYIDLSTNKEEGIKKVVEAST